MVIPANVLAAVEEGDISTVVAWLDAGGDVNDVTPAWPGIRGWPSSKTLLMAIPQTDTIGPRQIELVRILLQRGADVNKIFEVENSNYQCQALHFCLDYLPHPRTWDKSEGRAAILEIIGIYLAAGASLTQRNSMVTLLSVWHCHIATGVVSVPRACGYYCEPGRHSMHATRTGRPRCPSVNWGGPV